MKYLFVLFMNTNKDHCVALFISYCDTKLILYRMALNMRRKWRCDTAYWQHC